MLIADAWPTHFRRGWIDIFLGDGVVDSILREIEAKEPLETGGTLWGITDPLAGKPRHDILAIEGPPEDSVHTSNTFERGTRGGPEGWIETIEAHRAAGRDYLGEWHFHPSGTLELSDKDRDAMREITQKECFKGVALFLVIASSAGLACYLCKDGWCVRTLAMRNSSSSSPVSS